MKIDIEGMPNCGDTPEPGLEAEVCRLRAMAERTNQDNARLMVQLDALQREVYVLRGRAADGVKNRSDALVLAMSLIQTRLSKQDYNIVRRLYNELINR